MKLCLFEQDEEEILLCLINKAKEYACCLQAAATAKSSCSEMGGNLITFRRSSEVEIMILTLLQLRMRVIMLGL